MPSRNVLVLYNYGEGQNATGDQQSTSDFVDHLKFIYSGPDCNVTRYKKDFLPGSRGYDTLVEEMNKADIICCIMNKESDKDEFLNQAKQICFMNNRQFVVIGIGIKENEIPAYYQIQTNRCFANFEEAKMDTHFLNGIFRRPDEHYGEEVNENQEQLADEHGVEEVKLNQEKLPGETEEVKNTHENLYDGHEVEEVNANQEKISDDQENKEEDEEEKKKKDKGVWKNYIRGFLSLLILTACIYFGIEDKYENYVDILKRHFFY